MFKAGLGILSIGVLLIFGLGITESVPVSVLNTLFIIVCAGVLLFILGVLFP